MPAQFLKRIENNVLRLQLVLALGCCACNVSPRAPVTHRASDPVVARYEDKQLTLADVERSAAGRLFELRSAAAMERLFSELVEREARNRKISPDELMQKETQPRLPAPNDRELRELHQVDLAQNPTAPADFEAFKARLLGSKARAEERSRQELFFDQMLKSANVRVDLGALGRPNPAIRPGGPSLGPANAKVTIVEYTDFESPFCAQAQPTVEKLLEKYPRDVRFLFRQNPQSEHPGAMAAAQAALCADDQKRYSEYRKLLFAEQQAFTPERLVQFAQRLGLDVPKFQSCLEGGTKISTVKADIAEAQANGLEGTPVFSVNGTQLSGAHSFTSFRRLIRFEVPES
jgi:predicted DsbA family dithiol-disulfide isomerase